MCRFTTILWDVDGTLLDFLYAQRVCMRKCFEKMGMSITEKMLARYSEINDSYWRRLELGLITKDELLVGRFADLFKEFGIKGADPDAFRTAYETGLGEVFKYNENAYDICSRLYGKTDQYVITNGISDTQKNKLKLSGLDKFMEDIFISEDADAPKPFKEFFDYCMDRIREKDKRRMLIVGDSLTSDIKGGVLYGIPTCWYRPEGTVNNSDYIPDYEISRLEEIFEIIDESSGGENG